MDMGCEEGSTDLLLRRRKADGYLHILFLELKTTDGTLSPSQIDWVADYYSRFASRNTTYAVAYGFSEAKEVVSAWVEEFGD